MEQHVWTSQWGPQARRDSGDKGKMLPVNSSRGIFGSPMVLTPINPYLSINYEMTNVRRSLNKAPISRVATLNHTHFCPERIRKVSESVYGMQAAIKTLKCLGSHPTDSIVTTSNINV